MVVSTKKDIDLFLDFVRTAIVSGNRCFSSHRKKNINTLAKLGILPKDAYDYVIKLTPDEYISGPEQNHDPKGSPVWKFKKVIKGILIYIKIELRTKTDNSVSVISFHEDENDW